jgi:hypothetical protein
VISVTSLTLSFLFAGITKTPGAVRDRYGDALTFTAAVDVAVAAAVAAAVGVLSPLLLLLLPPPALLPVAAFAAGLLVSFVAGVNATPPEVVAVWLSVQVYVVKLRTFRLVMVMTGTRVTLQPVKFTLADVSTCWAP